MASSPMSLDAVDAYVQAASNGRLEEVQAALATGIPVDAANSSGSTGTVARRREQ